MDTAWPNYSNLPPTDVNSSQGLQSALSKEVQAPQSFSLWRSTNPAEQTPVWALQRSWVWSSAIPCASNMALEKLHTLIMPDFFTGLNVLDLC